VRRCAILHHPLRLRAGAEMAIQEVCFIRVCFKGGCVPVGDDLSKMDEANWKCFVNSVWDSKTGEWTVKKEPVVNLNV
jgi:hypothetical protein